jgi:hypothetical protein
MNGCPPVALFIFNRPDSTRRVLDALRHARPARLFIIADGPRDNGAGDRTACAAARETIVEGVNWPCEIRREFSDKNLGCARRVSSGLHWVFDQVESAIILEDDCVASEAFFKFTGELLRRFDADERLGVVSGSNFQPQDVSDGAGYYFSRYPHCWGWATWRRAWKAYDHAMTDWPAMKQSGWLRELLGSAREARYWEYIFDRVAAGEIDSWAYRWTFACWRRNFLTALPAANLVTNIGFDRAATHTTRGVGPRSRDRDQPWPLKHVGRVERNVAADRYTFEHHFHPPLWLRAVRKMRLTRAQ